MDYMILANTNDFPDQNDLLIKVGKELARGSGKLRRGDNVLGVTRSEHVPSISTGSVFLIDAELVDTPMFQRPTRPVADNPQA